MIGTRSTDPQTKRLNEDRKLALRAAAHDRDAQAELIRRLRATVQRTSRTLLPAHIDAEDAAQLTLLEILREADTYRGVEPVERWADQIAVRTTRRLADERRRTTVAVDATVDPDSLVEDDESVAMQLEGYLSALPPEQRAALVLRHSAGFSIDEIASMTRTSRNTIKYRLQAGLKSARRCVRRQALVTGASRT